MFRICKGGLVGRLTLAAVCFCVVGFAQSPKYKVGRAPTAEEVSSWSISILPDGTGLPEGKGTAVEGKDVYERRCSECHGNELQGGDGAALVGGQGTLASAKPLKTVGSYWPYATTLYDYIRRAMPQLTPGVLTADQTYAVVAYLLHMNEIVAEDAVMNAEALPAVVMPARDRFVPDDRRGGPEVR